MGKNLNRYEKAIMFNITVLKTIFFGIVIFNFFMPIFSPAHLGIRSPFQWIIVIIHFIGLLYGIGRLLGQRILLLPIVATRVLEVAWYRYIHWKVDFNLFPFIVCVLLDGVFVTYLLLDKSTYKYVVVKKKGNVVHIRRKKSDGSGKGDERQVS